MANVPSFIAPLYAYPPGQSPFWNIDKAGGPGNAQNEGGIDIPNPNHTPVYALGDGTLESCHLFWHNPPDVANNHGGAFGGGVITLRINIPGYGLNDMYFQHIDLNPVIPICLGGNCNNMTISKGVLLGWTRSPDPGEIEIGVNPVNWGPVWGPSTHPGPWVNPETRIRALVDADPNFNWGSQSNPSGVFGQQTLALGSAFLGSLKTGNNPIAPDAGVAAFFVGLDVALELQNPFDVSIDTTSSDFTILGIDTGISNPVSDARAVFEGAQQIGINIIQDLSALAFRVFFVIVGLAILTAIGRQSFQKTTDETLDKIGGSQGILALVGA